MRDPVGDVPGGYAVHRVGSTWLVLDRSHVSELTALRLADRAVRRTLFARAPRRGRGAAPSVPLTPDQSVVLRRYQHGGLLARLTGSLFLGPGRALSELRVTARAEASGAPVPRVLCLVLWPALGPLWSALIGTREERGACDLLDAVEASRQPRESIALARAVGTAIRKLHDAGVEHRDLQLRNILVTGGDAKRIVVVDLDRAVFHRYGRVPAGARARNLGRLARSATKTGLWGGRIGPRELAAFSGAYTAGDRTLRRELRALIPRERARLAAHRLTYPFRRVSPPRPAAAPRR